MSKKKCEACEAGEHTCGMGLIHRGSAIVQAILQGQQQIMDRLERLEQWLLEDLDCECNGGEVQFGEQFGDREQGK